MPEPATAVGPMIDASPWQRELDVACRAVAEGAVFSRGRRLTANQGVMASNGVLHDAILRSIPSAAVKR
jgi:hypothetical protein